MTEEGDMQPLPAALPDVPTAPDLLAPVHAFRDWRVTPDGLLSPRTGVPWTGRVMAATCHPCTAEDFIQPPHRAPGQACHCGIHAYFRPNYETSRVDYTGVTGIVTVWGHVQVHEHGLRAEFARVEAMGVYSRWTRRQKALVDEVAGLLGVDVVDLRELEAVAHDYATPVPASLAPARLAPAPERARRRRRLRTPSGARRLVIVGQ
jgi:hypothetical protein